MSESAPPSASPTEPPVEPSATPPPVAESSGDPTVDLVEEVRRIEELPSSANDLERLLEQTPEELRRLLKEEFNAEFLGPVVVNRDELD